MAVTHSSAHRTAVALVSLNLLLVACLAVVGWQIAREPSLRPPDARQLPTIVAASAPLWDAVHWSGEDRQAGRDVDTTGFAALYIFDWNRHTSPPMPDVERKQGETLAVGSSPPTMAEALNDLLGRIRPELFVGPRSVVVSVTATGERVTLVAVEAWHALPERSRRSGVMQPSLAPQGLPLEVVSIARDSWTVRYRYRDTPFTLELAPGATAPASFEALAGPQ